MKLKLFLFLSVVMLIGCTSNGAERKPMRPKNFISQEEIKELAIAQTAKGAIEVARSIRQYINKFCERNAVFAFG